MNLQQTIDLDRSILTLSARLGPLLEPASREALFRVSFITSEVRQFATRWSDAEGATHEGQAERQRNDATERLVKAFKPS